MLAEDDVAGNPAAALAPKPLLPLGLGGAGTLAVLAGGGMAAAMAETMIAILAIAAEIESMRASEVWLRL